jgi:hypothetical protein
MSRRSILIGTLLVAGPVAVCAFYAVSYFFLLDDFMVLHEAPRTVADLASSTVYNFYRPAGYLWGKGLFTLFGWEHPAGYITITMLVHAVCALLVLAVARRAGVPEGAAGLAGALFLVSPWGTEPFLWLSGGFDLVATSGLLVCLLAGLSVLPKTADRGGPDSATVPWVNAGVGLIGAVLALFAKETGVLAAPLFVFAVVCLRGPRALLNRHAALYLALLLAAAAIYLIIRERLLPGLDGGYGRWSVLMNRAPVSANIWAFWRALLVPPLPDAFPPGATVFVHGLGTLFTVVCIGLIVLAFVSQWRLALFCALGVLTSIAPVMWASVVLGNTSGNRMLYLPGVWFSVLMATALGRLRGPVRAAVTSVVLGVALVSLYGQMLVWREACQVSRTTMSQLSAHAGSPQPLFVTNLPSRSADGPYVMNTLSIASYFGSAFPRVEANLMAIKFDRGRPVFSFWLSDHRQPRPGEQALTLDLPIWMGDSRPAGQIDAPAPDTEVTQPFTVTGWTIDAGAREGSGVDAVNVYAYSLPGREENATLLGRASYGEPRPDVVERFGAQFANSGFRLEVSGLRAGLYRIVVHTRRPLARGADPELTVDVVVR